MNKAQEVKNHIEMYYKSGYINYMDLIAHLRDNKIDSFERTINIHSGCDVAYDDSMAVFYYNDGSMMVVCTSGITVSRK